MKVLVCGSRGWTDWEAVRSRVLELPRHAIVIEGDADGADKMARYAAEDAGLFWAEVPCKDVHWNLYGRSAGHKRNAAMLALGPELVVAFQSDGSSGTQGTIDNARRLGIPVEIHTGRGGSNG